MEAKFHAGLIDVETMAFEVKRTFQTFDEFWTIQTPAYLPTSKVVAGLTPEKRSEFLAEVKDLLETRADGSVSYSAVAHAVKARAP